MGQCLRRLLVLSDAHGRTVFPLVGGVLQDAGGLEPLIPIVWSFFLLIKYVGSLTHLKADSPIKSFSPEILEMFKGLLGEVGEVRLGEVGFVGGSVGQGGLVSVLKVGLAHFLLDFLVFLLFYYHIERCSSIFARVVGKQLHVGGGVMDGRVSAELEVL